MSETSASKMSSGACARPAAVQRPAACGSSAAGLARLSGYAALEAQGLFDRSLRKRHEKPDLEHREEEERNQNRDGQDAREPIASEPPHEKRDEDRCRNVDPEEPDHHREGDRRQEDLEDLLELRAFDEVRPIRGVCEQVDAEGPGAHQEQDEANVERKIAGLRPVLGPAGADPPVVVHDDDRKSDEQTGHHELDCPRRRGVLLAACLVSHSDLLELEKRARKKTSAAVGLRWSSKRQDFARKPAFSIRLRCVSAALVSHCLNWSPVMKVVLKAPFSMKSFHSGVSRTFRKRSTYQFTWSGVAFGDMKIPRSIVYSMSRPCSLQVGMSCHDLPLAIGSVCSIRFSSKTQSGFSSPARHCETASIGLFTLDVMWPPTSCAATSPPPLYGT